MKVEVLSINEYLNRINASFYGNVPHIILIDELMDIQII